MKKFSLMMLCSAAVLCASTAMANDQDAPAPVQGEPMKEKMAGKHFQETDTNKDGFINLEEWQAKGSKMFAEIDTNGDGKLTPDETKAHHKERHDAMKARREERRDRVEQRKETMGSKPAAEAPAAAQ